MRILVAEWPDPESFVEDLTDGEQCTVVGDSSLSGLIARVVALKPDAIGESPS